MFDCLETLGISGPVKESEEHSHNGIIGVVRRGGARGRVTDFGDYLLAAISYGT